MPTSDTELIETAHAGSTHNRTNGTPSNSPGGRLRAAPAARALAKRLGVDLTALTGTRPRRRHHSGRRHRKLRRQRRLRSHRTSRRRCVRQGHRTPRPPPPDSPSPTAPAPAFPGGEKLRGLRRAMSQTMSLAATTSPTARCSTTPIYITGARAKTSPPACCEPSPQPVRPNRLSTPGSTATPQSRRLMPNIDVGMAVDTGDGLIVPVIRDVGKPHASRVASGYRQPQASPRATER